MARELQVLEENGRRYVEPRGAQYRVRYYEPAGDLSEYLELIKNFENRFFHNVARGYEILKPAHRDGQNAEDTGKSTKLDEYIAAKQEAYKSSTGDAKELEGEMLHAALIRRAIEDAQEHIHLRMANGIGLNDTVPSDNALGERLEKLRKSSEIDFLTSYGLPKLRGTHGHVDGDDVLGEMAGESYKIFCATTAPIAARRNKIMGEFYYNRYDKIAQAMQHIDETVQVMAGLAAREAAYRDSDLQPELEKMAEAAKHRVQLLHGDDDFAAADVLLRTTRDSIHAALFKMHQEHEKQEEEAKKAATDAGNPQNWAERIRPQTGLMNPLSCMLLENATDLIYDMTTTHAYQKKRVDQLRRAVMQLLPGKERPLTEIK